IRMEGKVSDPGAAPGTVQVVMQPHTARAGEEVGRMAFQLAGTKRLGAAALLVAAIEQAVYILLHETLTAAHGLGVAEQEQDARPGLQLTGGHTLQQTVEQLDRRRLVAMDARRQQQVEAAILLHCGSHLSTPSDSQCRRAPSRVS